jgi:hypothetical protein
MIAWSRAVCTTCNSQCRRSVDDRVQHTWRILVQLCIHGETQVSSSLLACRDTACTELRIEACITCTCTNLFGPQNSDRKSNVCAHSRRGVPIKVSMSVSNAPWRVIRKSQFCPPIELSGHRVRVWWVIKCVLLVTDFMESVY